MKHIAAAERIDCGRRDHTVIFTSLCRFHTHDDNKDKIRAGAPRQFPQDTPNNFDRGTVLQDASIVAALDRKALLGRLHSVLTHAHAQFPPSPNRQASLIICPRSCLSIADWNGSLKRGPLEVQRGGLRMSEL